MVPDLKFLPILRAKGVKVAKPGREECVIVVLHVENLLFWRYLQPDYFFQISKNALISPNLIGQNWV
jgi:hypothetical protein